MPRPRVSLSRRLPGGYRAGVSAAVPTGRRRERTPLVPPADEHGAVHATFWLPLLAGLIIGLAVSGWPGAVVGLVAGGFVAGVASSAARAIIERRRSDPDRLPPGVRRVQ